MDDNDDKQRRFKRIRNRRRDRDRQRTFSDGPKLRGPRVNAPRMKKIDPRYYLDDEDEEDEEDYEPEYMLYEDH